MIQLRGKISGIYEGEESGDQDDKSDSGEQENFTEASNPAPAPEPTDPGVATESLSAATVTDANTSKLDEDNEPDPAISSLENKIALLTEQNENLRAENENLRERIEAINEVPEDLRDEAITSTLAAEPDTRQAGAKLTAYLQTVAARVLPHNMTASRDRESNEGTWGRVDATVAIVGRGHRIEVGDWVEMQNEKHDAPVLCKCTGIGEYMQRRKYQGWDGKGWNKEHVIVNEFDFRVITEAAARELAPAAFGAAKTTDKEEL